MYFDPGGSLVLASHVERGRTEHDGRLEHPGGGQRHPDTQPDAVEQSLPHPDAHAGRTEWTDPAVVTDLVLALVAGELDAWSGRFVRAGIDTVPSLRARAQTGLGPDERTLVLALGASDPLA